MLLPSGDTAMGLASRTAVKSSIVYTDGPSASARGAAVIAAMHATADRFILTMSAPSVGSTVGASNLQNDRFAGGHNAPVGLFSYRCSPRGSWVARWRSQCWRNYL